NAMQAMFSCRQHLNPISYDELLNITNIWVDAALRLEDRDLKLMSRLGRSQLKRFQAESSVQTMQEEVAYACAGRAEWSRYVRAIAGSARGGGGGAQPG